MLKYLGYLIVGLLGFALLMTIIGPKTKPYTDDQLSYGYVDDHGGCMSVREFNRKAQYVIENKKWPTNNATLSAAGFVVYLEMKRLGTPPCADLAPLYQTLSKADSKK
jgi:hypothetical protein